MAEENVNAQIEQENALVQDNKEQVNVSYENIIKKCIANGWTRTNKIRVKNVNVTEKDDYTMVSFTIIPPIEGYVFDEETGEYKLGKTNVIFSSSYAIAGAMKEDENLSWLANKIIEKPAMINLLINGGTIDIISKHINEGENYINPFTTQENPEPVPFDHDTIVNIVVGLSLSNNGKQVVEEGRRIMAAQLFGI